MCNLLPISLWLNHLLTHFSIHFWMSKKWKIRMFSSDPAELWSGRGEQWNRAGSFNWLPSQNSRICRQPLLPALLWGLGWATSLLWASTFERVTFENLMNTSQADSLTHCRRHLVSGATISPWTSTTQVHCSLSFYLQCWCLSIQ